jgi:hypothetical protein
MSESVLAIDLKVTCADHGTHEGVILKMVDDKVIYETPSGEQLKGDCRVETIDAGTFVVPPMVFAAAIAKYRGQN